MKNKGFTLVELIAVIVILGLIALIAVPAITSLIKRSKVELSDAQKKTILISAQNWATEAQNIGKMPANNGECKSVSISVLQKDGFVDLDIKDPKTNKSITAIWVEIRRVDKRLEYEVTEIEPPISLCPALASMNP